MESAFSWISEYGYWAFFSLLMLGILGLPIPDETLLMFAGYLVSQGKLTFQPTMATAFLGSVCGISLSYFLGWWISPPIVLRCEQVFHPNTSPIVILIHSTSLRTRAGEGSEPRRTTQVSAKSLCLLSPNIESSGPNPHVGDRRLLRGAWLQVWCADRLQKVNTHA
ncbi:MAG: hypothetical protein OEM58_11325 [Nitrospirota bacterium]|nr:hypothetical protein [Nitrospirota bacterium]